MTPAAPPALQRVRRALAILGAALLAAVLAGGIRNPAAAQNSGDDTPWPMVQHDSAHGGAAEDGPSPPYRRAWTAELPGGPVAGAVVTDDQVIVVGGTSIAAFDPATGETLWEQARSDGPAGVPAIAGNLVVHSTGVEVGAALVARRLEDGREAWRAFTGGAVAGGPAVDGDRIYAATRPGAVLALDAVDGGEVWRFKAEGQIVASPAVADGVVVAVAENLSTGNATAYGLDVETGDERWRFTQSRPAPGASSPAIGGDVVIVGTGDGVIHALDPGTGAERWAVPAQAGFTGRSVPAAPDDLFIADLGDLYRLDPVTGGKIWTYRLPDLFSTSAPALVDDWAVIGDRSGVAAAIDVDTGLLVWQAQVGPGAVSAPAVDADHVYLSSQGKDGAVVALEHDPDGALVSIPSPTTLFPLRAMLNFAAAFVLVAAAALALTRLVLRPRREGEEPDEDATDADAEEGS